jgi:hypothetical protein
MRKILRIFLAMGLVAMMATSALASLALDFTSSSNSFSPSTQYSLGFSFSPKVSVNVTALGYFDADANGLVTSHPVGIYDANGNLLAFTTVSTTDPLTSWFRFHDITPLTLEANQTYVIAGYTSNQDNYTWDPEGFTTDSNINFLSDRYIGSLSLAFPTSSSGVTGYFGPNFLVSAVPVPPTVILLGSGLLSLAGWRRFRKG